MKKKSTYKVTDLFGNENLKIIRHSPPKHNLFDDYDTWLEKFQHKKTTDDVYTPHSIYTVVLDYLAENYDLQGKEILRPFYPGGDYERFNYPKNGIVVDNPPFSIISSICRFYIKNDIPFLLFAPHLTLFSSDIDATHIVVGANIRYENGAIIKTSFLSNMFGTAKIIGEPMLYIKIKQVQEEKKIEKLKYQYPNNVLTVSRVQQLIERGYSIRIDKHQVRYCRRLDGQKAHKKSIFGSGFFIPDNISTKIAEQINNQPTDIIYWQLSQREQAMIKALNQLTTNTFMKLFDLPSTPYQQNPMARLFGITPGKKCKDCAHALRDRKWYKCEMRKQRNGEYGGQPTDIKLKWDACGKFAPDKID